MKYLILAGGSGTRLWPLSRKHFAKQFLNLTNDFSMLQNTATRVSKQSGKDIFVISNEDSKFIINDQLKEILPDYSYNNLIIEPIGRNTAPAIAYSMLFFNPDDIITILSSDHHIENKTEFNHILDEAENIAKKNHIVTLGIIPDSPKTGYGYIKRSDEKINSGYKVDKFVEKPSEEKAKEYIENGKYFWNAGIFIFKVSAFFEELKKYSPDIFEILQKIKLIINNNNKITKENFIEFPNISIDYAVMEKSDSLVVIPSEFGWSDVGSFNSLFDILPKDNNNNAIKFDKENFINIESKNLLIFGNSRKIATINLKDLIIIDTPDALLISDNKNTENVKDVVKILQDKKSIECESHLINYRPWGTYKILERNNNYQVNQLCIFPEQKISLQYHKKRSETWTILEGTADIIKENENFVLKNSESIFIPANTKHRITNNSKDKNLILIEIQSGINIDEKDIYRLEDEYSRI